MSIRSRNIRTTVTSSGAAVVELIASPNRPCKVKEIGIILVNATASVFALGRPAAKGITPTTPVGLLDLANGDPYAYGATLAAAWGTGPTLPAAYYRVASLPATAGASLNPPWKFSNGLIVPAGGSLIIWTLSAVSLADIYFEIDE